MTKEIAKMDLIERIAAGQRTDWPRSLSDVLVERVVGEVSQRYKAPLQELLVTLQAVESRAWKDAPKELRDALTQAQSLQGNAAGTLEHAYLLGMLAFANRLLAVAADRRFDDIVYEVIRDDAYRPILEHLRTEQKRTVEVEELARVTGREYNVVCKQVYYLGQLGIVGWHETTYGTLAYLSEAGEVLLGIHN